MTMHWGDREEGEQGEDGRWDSADGLHLFVTCVCVVLAFLAGVAFGHR